jgi:DNA-binding CsgD family transcriptional regulator
MAVLQSGADRDTEAFSALVSDIYDTVLDHSRWPDTLRHVAQFVGGPAAGLYAKDAVAKTGNLFYGSSEGLAHEYVRLYFETYVRLDPSTTAHYFMNVGDVGATADLLPYEDFVQTRFYREWARPQGLVDHISSVLDKSATGVTLIGVFRGTADGLADEGARHRLRLVSPHARRAVLIGGALDQTAGKAAALGEMIDTVRSGMLLVDAMGRIVHANAAALEMIEAGDVLRRSGDHLTVADAETDRTFRTLFAAAGEGDMSLGTRGIAFPVTGAAGERYAVSLLPLCSGVRRVAGSRLAAVTMLFIHRAQLTLLSAPEMIAKAYGLTPSELRILLAVVEVGGAAEVAEALGIGESTVRFHLKRLFAKTGTHRQAGLVKLVAGFANPLVG